MNRALRSTLFSGACAGIASTLALGVMARWEGKAAVQPVNATSHWRNGARAGSFTGVDLAHTATGLATHQAATFFWAALFAWAIAWRGRLRPLPMAGYAAATSVIAAAVDYGPTPKRFTPGWEFVLSKRSMAVAYAAMAAGLAAGASLAQRR